MRCTARATAAHAVCKGELQLLRQDADRGKEMRPRWKRCVQFTNGDLGEALGKAYVAEEFPPASKAATLKMVNELEAALKTDITDLSWMTPETKQQALDKLAHIANKIGYPDKWRDYSTLTIVRGDALGNALRANRIRVQARSSTRSASRWTAASGA